MTEIIVFSEQKSSFNLSTKTDLVNHMKADYYKEYCLREKIKVNIMSTA